MENNGKPFKKSKFIEEKGLTDRIIQIQKLREEFNEARKNGDKIKEDEIFMKIYNKFTGKLNHILNSRHGVFDGLGRFGKQFEEDFKQEFKFQLLKRISNYKDYEKRNGQKNTRQIDLLYREYKSFFYLPKRVYNIVLEYYVDGRRSKKTNKKEYCRYFTEIDELTGASKKFEGKGIEDILIDEDGYLDKHTQIINYDFYIERIRGTLIAFHTDRKLKLNEESKKLTQEQNKKVHTGTHARHTIKRLKRFNKDELLSYLKKGTNKEALEYLKKKIDEGLFEY